METDPLLPISVGPFDPDHNRNHLANSRPTPKHILKIALRVKELIDIIIPIIFKEADVTKPDSAIIDDRVIELVKRAAGGKGDGAPNTSSQKYQASLIFVLLTVKRWYHESAEQLLFDAKLYQLRAAAAESIAQRIIEGESDERYLFRDMLCSRYSITLHGEDSEPMNALELAVDLHSTGVIATSGYQRCITWLWRGWIIQDSLSPNEYVFYKELGTNDFWTHFTPDRLKTPNYQNYIQLTFCFIYLILFTLTINTLQQGGDFDVPEGLFYAFTFGELISDVTKAYHLGLSYIGFWNLFNDSLYVLVTISLAFRLSALRHPLGSDAREDILLVAYRVLACCAPFVWMRILLYLESLQFFGVMLVCLSQMIRESMIFFVLLAFLSCGFLQAFVGLDASDGSTDIDMFGKTVHVMLTTVMMSPNFESLDSLAMPYGKILYYLFTFFVTLLLINILIALFNSAYVRVYDNANDEYLALQAEKTLRFIRAPDSYVYVPPLNIIELLFVVPFGSVCASKQYQKLNYAIMYIFYWPVLLFTAYFESRTAQRVKYNRMRGMDDDANELDQEWDLLDGYRIEMSGSSENADADSDGSDDAATRRRIVKSKRTRQLSNNMSNNSTVELLQMNNAIKFGDPEFHIDEELWQRDVVRCAPKIELGQHHGSGWENYWLLKELNDIKQQIGLPKTIKSKRSYPSTTDVHKTGNKKTDTSKTDSPETEVENVSSSKLREGESGKSEETKKGKSSSNKESEEGSNGDGASGSKAVLLTEEKVSQIIDSAIAKAVEKAVQQTIAAYQGINKSNGVRSYDENKKDENSNNEDNNADDNQAESNEGSSDIPPKTSSKKDEGNKNKGEGGNKSK